MSEKRRTYKTEKQQSKKLSRITFRVTEEEQDLIRKNTRDAGFLTESEYLRYRTCSPEHLTDTELQELKTDIIYCREWIEQHKETIDNIISAIQLLQRLFS